MTPYAEVIGDPIAQSKSPAIHGFWLSKLGIEAEYRACQVPPADLPRYLSSRRREANWRGCNVTMPHKQSVIPYLGRLDPLAEQVGAVNVIIRRADDTLVGHNSDVAGVSTPLRRCSKASYPNHVATYVYIVGAGGAARAAALGAVQAGFGDFDIFNRSLDKAHELAKWIGAPFGEGHGLEEISPIRNPGEGLEQQRYSHVIINATSMGMNGSPSPPISLVDFYPDTIVFDLVYSPLETPLLTEARRLRMRTIDGLEMLVEQAALAFEMFFGAPAPREHDAELRALLSP